VVFQCVRYAWKRGVLQALADAGARGRSVDELAATGRWSGYALRVVLESCLSAGVASLVEGRYVLDKTGWCVLTDEITRINYDFVHDVCYQGLHDLERSLDEQRPHGLKALGDWPTLYEGMAVLPEPARASWFAFDHHYSDTSFPQILPDVLATAPKRVMDVGANTGKFARALLAHDAAVRVELVDLPQQLALAEPELLAAGVRDRAGLNPVDMLDPAQPFPGGVDLVWMSQFLSCFSEEVIVSILRRAAAALVPGGQLLILDTLWDRQRYDIASYCLINTSPYFTAMASGNSKVYQSGDYVRLAEAAGFRLLATRDGIGYCHSLQRFVREGA
jgi:SAM-dependent methyltransferase